MVNGMLDMLSVHLQDLLLSAPLQSDLGKIFQTARRQIL